MLGTREIHLFKVVEIVFSEIASYSNAKILYPRGSNMIFIEKLRNIGLRTLKNIYFFHLFNTKIFLFCSYWQ